MASYEDWAESFATYIHCERLNKPYEVVYFKKVMERKTRKIFNVPKATLSCCWKDERCRKKREILESLLAKLKE
jgi:hypothetical protein